jgi:hypothetical protein
MLRPVPDVPGEAHPQLHCLARRIVALDREIDDLLTRRDVPIVELEAKLAAQCPVDWSCSLSAGHEGACRPRGNVAW